MKVKYLFFSLVAAAFLTSAMSVDKTLEVGSKAPRIETIQGDNVVADENSDSKIKVVSFWNPKNPASRISNRNLSLQYSDKAENNIEFISICTDSDKAMMNEVMKIDGVKADRSYDYSQINPRVFKDYDVVKSPKAFMISEKGEITNIF